MKKKVIICGYTNFPRGSASANYVQYLAQAFMDLDYDVVIVSNLNYEELNKNDNFYERYKNRIYLEDIVFNKNKIIKYLNFKTGLGKIFKKVLKKYSFSSEDIIISYSRDPFLNMELNKIAKKEGIKSGACVVEWFPFSEFKYGYFDIEFWKEWINFNYILTKYDFLFPISTFIEKFFIKKGWHMLSFFLFLRDIQTPLAVVNCMRNL